MSEAIQLEYEWEPDQCDECGGDKDLWIPCRACEGDGFHDSAEFDICETCQGLGGWYVCPECSGF